ncbi:hypothetical protein Pfo_029413 [Paulownia fortunei]|nr:hypothetical protein Pfo_029413 [Paulownia fortunei]
MKSITGWQVIFLRGIALWIVISSILNVIQKLRSLTQPWASQFVISGTPIILKIQKYKHRHLDALFSGLSCVVSVPFYTAFLPLLFWNSLYVFWFLCVRLGIANWLMTLLMAFCVYTGNCIKDVVSAPRPSSPPVRIVTATKDEEENAMEYGLHSSHTLNTVFLSGLLHNIFNGFLFLVYCLLSSRRIYLGMHSLIDVIGGLALGLGILAIYFLLLFAYPTPELPTPSFEYHTAFNGVALGVVTGIHQTFQQFHHENVAHIFSPQLTTSTMVARLWPNGFFLANALGIPKSDEIKQSGFIQKLFFSSKQTSFYVDTGIRLLQHAGLALSVVDLVPCVFSHLGL